MRTFESGATRDDDHRKLDFEGSLSPQVLWEVAAYMERCSTLPDGSVRPADNWKRGWDRDVSLKSLLRHVMDLWLLHHGCAIPRPEDGHVPTMTDALGGAFFNVQAYWLRWLEERPSPPRRPPGDT